MVKESGGASARSSSPAVKSTLSAGEAAVPYYFEAGRGRREARRFSFLTNGPILRSIFHHGNSRLANFSQAHAEKLVVQ